ncbi:hypothetical protein AB0Q93_23260, partial [Streptomyces sp. NPDC088184]
MNGLYALKPWYADRLSGVRASLVRHEVSPDTLTAAGVVAAAGAAAALAWLPAGPAAALPVALLLAARLALSRRGCGSTRCRSTPTPWRTASRPSPRAWTPA